MKYIKENYKFSLFVLIAGIIGAYFSTIYTLSSVDQETLDIAIEQVGSKGILIAVSTIQAVVYYVILCGIFGLVLSNKVGLWKKIIFEKSKIKKSIIVAILGGLIIVFSDLLIFGHFNEIIKHSFDTKPTIEYILSAFLYGGVIEEVIMRLFLMSLVVWIISKIFYKKEIPTKVYIIANIITALLFAVGHLPYTIQLFGKLDIILLIRCFLLNGGFGLAFGYLYRKYGIQYSMLAHFGCHLVSIIIQFLI